MLTKKMVKMLVRMGEYAHMEKKPYCTQPCIDPPPNSRRYGWICTREKGHTGEHVAHIGANNFVLRVWDEKRIYYANNDYAKAEYE